MHIYAHLCFCTYDQIICQIKQRLEGAVSIGRRAWYGITPLNSVTILVIRRMLQHAAISPLSIELIWPDLNSQPPTGRRPTRC